MASIQHDSEAMVHQVAATPVTSQSASHIASVFDTRGRALVFSIGNDERLYALEANEFGTSIPLDLGTKLGITDSVQAFAVSQNRDSGKVYIAFATGATKLSPSTIHIMDGILPAFVDTKDEDLRRMLLSTDAPPSNICIENLHINPATEDKWPLLIGVWRKVQSTDDIHVMIARVRIQERRWEWITNLEVNTAIKNIRSVCPIRTPIGEAIACLYQYENTKSIYVMTTNDDQHHFHAIVEAPEGSDPRSLAAILDDENYSTLLISGSGLSRLTSDQLFTGGSRATIISSASMYQTASRLTVSQTGQEFVLWFLTDDNTLGYQRWRVDQVIEGRVNQVIEGPVSLTSDAIIDFSPLLDPKTGSQTLMVLKEKNKLGFKAQSGDTKMWKDITFMVQQLDKFMDVQAFVTHIEARDADGMLIREGEYNLSCSGWTSALVNGRECVLGSEPTVVRTNERGVITIIVPAEDITSYVYKLESAGVTKAEHQLHESYVIDPSQKVQDRLEAAFKSGESLNDIETPNGKLLDGSAKPEDVEAAEKFLKQVPDILKNVKTKSAFGPTGVPPAAMDYAAYGWILKPSEWWEWIKETVKEVGEWIVKKVQDAWHFVVDIAGEAWAFILNTTAEVFKSVTWLLKKVGAGLKEVWGWLSYIFNIEDIKATAHSLRTIFDSSLVYAEEFVKSGVKPVEDWANGLEDTITKALGVQLPPNFADQKQSPKDHTAPKTGGSVSATANVTFYHLEQGQDVEGPFAPSGTISNIYVDIIEPILQEFKNAINDIADKLMKMFRSNGSTTINDILQIVGVVVHALVQSLKNVVVGIIKLGADLIHYIKEIIETPIAQFPVIGPILKHLGFKVTILDIIVYALAVPVTVYSGGITGQPPRRIDAIDYQALVKGTLTNKDVLLAYSKIKSYLGITAACGESLWKIYKLLTVTSPQKPKTFSAMGLAFDFIVAAGTFPWDRNAPAWNFRLAIWSAKLARKLVQAICLKANAPPQLAAAIEGAVAVVGFCFAQAVHHDELASPNKVWGDPTIVSLSIVASVFEVVEAISSTAGTLVPEAQPVAIVTVAACGACCAVVKTGRAVRKHELKDS